MHGGIREEETQQGLLKSHGHMPLYRQYELRYGRRQATRAAEYVVDGLGFAGRVVKYHLLVVSGVTCPLEKAFKTKVERTVRPA